MRKRGGNENSSSIPPVAAPAEYMGSPVARLTPSAPTAEALDRCRLGDTAAVEEFFRNHVGLVTHVLGRLVGPVADLEDLTQTVFVEAITALGRYRGDASFKTWLLRIAVHVGHHYLRSAKVRRHVPLDLVPDEALGDDERDHELLLDERRLAPELYDVLGHVDPKKRIALLLYVIEGYAVEDIASLMGATTTATRSRIFFARRELRKLLGKHPRLSSHVAALLRQGEDEP
jgi:RNA polymerase sigma-70 factor, ECF subfamily